MTTTIDLDREQLGATLAALNAYLCYLERELEHAALPEVRRQLVGEQLSAMSARARMCGALQRLVAAEDWGEVVPLDSTGAPIIL